MTVQKLMLSTFSDTAELQFSTTKNTEMPQKLLSSSSLHTINTKRVELHEHVKKSCTTHLFLPTDMHLSIIPSKEQKVREQDRVENARQRGHLSAHTEDTNK